jgi:hypothetical protein
MSRATQGHERPAQTTFEPLDGYVGVRARAAGPHRELCVQAVSSDFEARLDAHSSCVIASRRGDELTTLLEPEGRRARSWCCPGGVTARPSRTPVVTQLWMSPRNRSRSVSVGGGDAVAGISHVAVKRLDVVAVRIEQVRGVIPRRVVAVVWLAVRREASTHPRRVECVDLCP